MLLAVKLTSVLAFAMALFMLPEQCSGHAAWQHTIRMFSHCFNSCALSSIPHTWTLQIHQVEEDEAVDARVIGTWGLPMF